MSLFFYSESHPCVFSPTQRNHLPGSTPGQEPRLKELLLAFSYGTEDASWLPHVGFEQNWSQRLGDFACFVSINCTYFFYVICAFFLQLKIRKKNMEHIEKKIIKDFKNIRQKNSSFSLYTLHTEQAHTLRWHTQTHTAVPTLPAPLKIRLIRNRKIINKLMKRVGKQNTAWRALLRTHTHWISWTQTHAHPSWNYMFCS